MKLFGKRLRWGMKLWLVSGVLMFPLMIVGELIQMPWLFFVYGVFLVLIVMPSLYIVEGLNGKRGGKSIMWEDD